jgi:competence protein ComEA
MRCLITKAILAIVCAVLINSIACAAVDINTATQTELENVKGFGPVKAQAIIDYRQKHGHFKSIDELDKVSGIGPGTISKVRKALSISPPDQSNNTLTRTHLQHPKKTLSTTNGVIDEFSAR